MNGDEFELMYFLFIPRNRIRNQCTGQIIRNCRVLSIYSQKHTTMLDLSSFKMNWTFAGETIRHSLIWKVMPVLVAAAANSGAKMECVVCKTVLSPCPGSRAGMVFIWHPQFSAQSIWNLHIFISAFQITVMELKTAVSFFSFLVHLFELQW